MNQNRPVRIDLPGWADEFVADQQHAIASQADRMRLVIAASRLNIERATGGPFGAAVFDLAEKKLVSLGLNLVTRFNCSVLHAEIVAIIRAQLAVESYDLSAAGSGTFELVTSTEPCAMCLGAIPWSGIGRVVCGARGEDAERIGFHEGRKPAGGGVSLRNDGIEVITEVLRDEAAAVLCLYKDMGGEIYNSGKNDVALQEEEYGTPFRLNPE